ncbi:hypothetical protein LDENG_00081370 [Lucifuga dentata]|nr:hypothetical protein LDENG_00081370 [Lucifuga dentata]
MALSSEPSQVLIEDSSLENWEVIGSGGFGQVYKARHLIWGCDVAIKLLHYDDGSSLSLLHEVNIMHKSSNPRVIQVLGVFQGPLPKSRGAIHLGLVMEFMERGSLASLQDILREPPPLALVFRQAHQVALGINFLHNLSPPVLHLDLKPSNVLLDGSLNAKLTDFGLAKFYHSIKQVSKKDGEEEGGTISYMPPEAFSISYNPTKASDIYSYGILLWSIVTGEQPYERAASSIVRLRIPKGDRPLLKEISSQAAGLVELMQKCWQPAANQRPSSLECTTKTEELYTSNKHGINDAVHEVLKKLDRKAQDRTNTQTIRQVHDNQPIVSPRAENMHALTGPPPVQEVAGGLTTNQRDKASVKGQPSSRLANVCYSDHSPSSSKVKSSSSYYSEFSPSPSVLPGTPPKDRRAKPSPAALQPNLNPQCQRQFSIPDFVLCDSRPAVHMHLSNVTGFQHGNNNQMCIHTTNTTERRRHPTAPSSVNLPRPRSGSLKGKEGRIG